jgi:hypothetical protein
MAIAGDEITLGNALAATSSLHLRDLDHYNMIGPMPLGAVTVADLPLQPLQVHAMSLKHFFDIIADYDGEVDHNQLRPIIRDKAWGELPAPFSLPAPAPFSYKMQLFILPQADGKHCILKHYYVADEKIKPAAAIPLIRGQAMQVRWGANIINTRKALQYMLELMGGMQFRIFTLTAEKKRNVPAAVCPSDEDMDKGFAYILEHGERDKSDLAQLKWVLKNISNNSPIHGWTKGLVQEALSQLAADGTMAKTCRFFPLTLQEVDDQILAILEDLVPHCREKSMWFLGEPGVGKTLMARALAMLWSRHHGSDGVFKTANDIDFFRGTPFTKAMPAIFDDGDVNLQTVAKLKAFADVSDEEAITRERWTSAKFVQGQVRLVCDNKHHAIKDLEDRNDTTISHQDFMLMMAPAFPPDITNANAMALLKRSVVFINTKRWLYFRAPGEDERDVPRMAFVGRPDFFKPSARPIISQYRRGVKEAPQGHEAAILWEQNWLQEALRKADAGPDKGARATPPTQRPPTIKIEREEFFDMNMGLSAACRGQPLVVDTPPRKKIKEEIPARVSEWQANAFAELHRKLAEESANGAICCDSPSPQHLKRQGSDVDFNLERELSQFISEGAGGASSGTSGDKRARRDGLDPEPSQGSASGPSGSSGKVRRVEKKTGVEARGGSKDENDENGEEDVFGHMAAGL